MHETQPLEKNRQYTTDTQNKHLLNNDNFQLLLTLQNTIYQTTQVKPSLHKLVNLIITQVDTNLISQQLIEQYC